MSDESQRLIKLEGVTKKYLLGTGEYFQALSRINLSINQGEFVSIMGPSGSGKSTLMHIMGALDVPTEGSYYLKGQNISTYTEDELSEIRNKEIGFVFQFFNLLPRTTVYKNVERPMFYAGLPPSEREKRVRNSLETVGLIDKVNNLSNQLSGGQIQRVAIARALIMEPSIILADEPTGNLDSKTSHEIMTILKSLNEDGHTIIIITHEEDIANYAQRKIKLFDGRIISDEKVKK